MADTTFLQADLRERAETDTHLAPWMILLFVGAAMVAMAALTLPVAAEFAGAPAGPVALFATALFMLFILASSAVSLYITYHLVKRRDRHFARLARLAEDATVYLTERARETGVGIEDLRLRLEAVQRGMREQAGERGAAIWTILCFLAGGIVYYVLFYVLADDYRRHEANEAELLTSLNEGLAAVGAEAGLVLRPQIPERRFWLYVLYTFITFGIFWVYWFYVMMADPNRHFEAQAEWEWRLAQVIG